MSLEKINEFVQEEMKKRELSEDMTKLQKDVYEKVVIKKAKILSLEESLKAIQFAQVEAPVIKETLDKLNKELEEDKEVLTKTFESMIVEANKEDFVKLLKKTKFIHREAIDYKIFNNLRNETINIIKEKTNEELLLLSPYKVADLVQGERKLPAIGKFLDLYKPETQGTDIDGWINKYSKKEDDEQQIRVHFAEISNGGFFTDTMIEDIAIRWSIMIGLSGNMKNDPETQKPLDPEMQEAVKEVTSVIKNNVVSF